MEGMGNLPSRASLDAAIKPKDMAGKIIKPANVPKKGSNEQSEIKPKKIKNKPLKAKGWRQKVLMPCLTQLAPVRAVTT
jgi:hypothetical protein